jgi:hypothetical protein
VSAERIIGSIFFENAINSERHMQQILCPFLEL